MGQKSVLVTGAIGLIGNAVRRKLENRGTTVIAVDRAGTVLDGREVVECDVSDVHGLYALAHKHDIGGIIHCAGFSGPMVSPDHPVQIVQVNTLGTTNIAELARLIGNVRIVFASTATAYGATLGGPVPENAILLPSSMYGASKAAAEHLLNGYRSQFGVDTVSLRFSWVYGPRRSTSCIIRQILVDSLQGKTTHIPYGRDFYRQYMHIDDAADAMIAALDSTNLPQQAYNITGGTRLTLSEVADVVKRVVPGVNVRLADGDDPGDVPQGYFDISAAKRDLGYEPKVSLERGVTSYFKWLKDHEVVKVEAQA
jgi:UDP-glucuronate 4-epimerase